jgi:FkbM family methyltransferase
MFQHLIEKFKHAFRISVYYVYYVLLTKLFKIYHKEHDRLQFLEAQPPVVKLVELNQTRFAVYISCHGAIEDSILTTGHWSSDLLLLGDYFVTPNSAIIEVGANIGFESLYFAKRFPDSLVYSYEPGTYPHDCLLLSKSYNHLENLRVFKLAVGHSRGIAEMSSPTEECLNKGLGSLKENKDLERHYKREQVEVVTLDTHFSEKRRVSFLKIDTQGFEWDVLQGATQTIHEHRPAIIFEHEDHYHAQPGELRRNIARFFDQACYDLYSNGSRVLRKIDFSAAPHFHGDVIALSRK